MSDILMIGIAGGTGSGKSTLTKHLKETFGEDVTVLMHDNYYKAHDDLSYEERSKLNYDHPNAFDTDLMIEHVRQLRAGILIFECKELIDLLDIKIFVDTDADVRILRRILRDTKERGRSLDSIITQYLNTVKPMHEQFVEPSKKYADLIVPEGGENRVALEMIMQRVASHLNKG